MALFTRKEYKKSNEFFQMKKGESAKANYYLGQMFEFGYGTKKDLKKATKYYAAALELENSRFIKSLVEEIEAAITRVDEELKKPK
ncbi:MAG: SEL1-like repeat protein [Planctomycetaceae bacterium]|jgi:TPR repeat protein|nr:SEL1-like repeat protein [Planctomycetaceae bacterium]